MSYSFSLNVVSNSKYYYFRDYSSICGSSLLSLLESLDWTTFYNESSIDCKLESFNSIIQNIFHQSVPVKKKVVSSILYPWFSSEVKVLIAEREFLYRKSKHSDSPELRKSFKQVRNKTNSLIKKLKFSYYRKKLDPSLSPKMLWSNLRQLGVCGKEKQDCDLDPEILNKFFIDSVPPSNFSNVPFRPINDDCNNFSFKNVDEYDVFNAVLSIKSDAIGLDGIHPKFIKLILPYILPILTHLFNHCLTSSSFPSLWKKACVIPVPKKNICSEPSDFRPISILCFLSKVFEKIIFNQIVSYLDCAKLLTPWQSGFRKFHSCETATLKVSSDIRNFLDNGHFVALCLLDFSKAFDSVSHSLLLLKLVNLFSFSSSAISLIASFLSNRTQKVKSNNLFSNELPVTIGVPQGSILGPLFFSLFINDLPLFIKFCLIHLYADDVQLYLKGSYINHSLCTDNLNFDLKCIWQWSLDNGLVLNPSKSQYMLIGDTHRLNNISAVYLHNEQLSLVSKVKNLGVIFNNKMTCCDHTQFLLGKVYAGLRSLRLTSQSLTTEMRRKLIITLIMPHFCYGSVIYTALDSCCAKKSG